MMDSNPPKEADGALALCIQHIKMYSLILKHCHVCSTRKECLCKPLLL